MLEGASRGLLENEFGTSNEDDVVLKILQRGSLQEFEVGFFLFLSVLFCSPHPIPSYPTTSRHGFFLFWGRGGCYCGSVTPVFGEGMTARGRRKKTRAAARETTCGCRASRPLPAAWLSWRERRPQIGSDRRGHQSGGACFAVAAGRAASIYFLSQLSRVKRRETDGCLVCRCRSARATRTSPTRGEVARKDVVGLA